MSKIYTEINADRAPWYPQPTHMDIHVANPSSAAFHIYIKIAGVGRNRDRALVFRGWSRLCLHAASLSAGEGASAARDEAMEAEATAAAGKVTARRRAATVAVDVAASRRQEKQEEDGALMLAAGLKRRKDAVDQVLQEQRERRAKMLVRRSDSLALPLLALWL